MFTKGIDTVSSDVVSAGATGISESCEMSGVGRVLGSSEVWTIVSGSDAAGSEVMDSKVMDSEVMDSEVIDSEAADSETAGAITASSTTIGGSAGNSAGNSVGTGLGVLLTNDSSNGALLPALNMGAPSAAGAAPVAGLFTGEVVRVSRVVELLSGAEVFAGRGVEGMEVTVNCWASSRPLSPRVSA